MLRKLLIHRLTERVMAEQPDTDPADLKAAFDAVMPGVDQSQHPILDWLTGGQFIALLKLILELIAMFKTK